MKRITRILRLAALTALALVLALPTGCIPNNAGVPAPKPVKADRIPSQAPAGDPALPYYLYYEKGSHTLTVYMLGDDGEYSMIYASYMTAHGGNKTPTGTFALGARERWHGWEKSYAQFATLYYGSELYLHSPTYHSMDPNDLWESYYDGEHGIGLDSTGGCLRMETAAARFIFENCPEGTLLTIVNGSPLGTVSSPPPDRHGQLFDPTDVTAKELPRK